MRFRFMIFLVIYHAFTIYANECPEQDRCKVKAKPTDEAFPEVWANSHGNIVIHGT